MSDPFELTAAERFALRQKQSEKKRAAVIKANENKTSVLGEMGFCDRCGKSVSSGGTWHEGKFYGPDCIKKISME